MLGKTKPNVPSVTDQVRKKQQKKTNLWLLRQFYNVNIIPTCEQERVKFMFEFKFTVAGTQNSKEADS